MGSAEGCNFCRVGSPFWNSTVVRFFKFDREIPTINRDFPIFF